MISRLFSSAFRHFLPTVLLAAALSGIAAGGLACRSVNSVDRVPYSKLQEEGSIVFTRAARYTMFFGTYSQRDFIEIVYERASVNEAGQLVVEAGIRNRGPVSWTNWMRQAPDSMTLAARCNFYQGQYGPASGGAIRYSTNRQQIVIKRGETYAYRAVCPKTEIGSYQLVLGE